MHIWPSMKIRESFKVAYLEKLELNLHRMNSQKKKNTASVIEKKLLDETNNQRERERERERDIVVDLEMENRAGGGGGALLLCQELLMILSCCYCCFCFGACVDKEGN
ncbi:uncharacterized protein LOC114285123 [Camellia sinensis]|uniref:uncharacterized protein LOC114285123 n=1 Tax=Camellia sinensis TaxID=4442 RepID=UPI001036C02B|nr:uncharacterized protein LOC114285123 [Camellia sinensis]